MIFYKRSEEVGRGDCCRASDIPTQIQKGNAAIGPSSATSKDALINAAISIQATKLLSTERVLKMSPLTK